LEDERLSREKMWEGGHFGREKGKKKDRKTRPMVHRLTFLLKEVKEIGEETSCNFAAKNRKNCKEKKLQGGEDT